MAKVIVYSQPTCPTCKAGKEWLTSLGVEFEDRNVRENPAWMNELFRLGSESTPTIVVNAPDGPKVVIGFDRKKLYGMIMNGWALD